MKVKMFSELAILGGNKINDKEPMQWCNSIDNREKQAVLEVLESGVLSGFQASANEMFWGGNKVQDLEKAFKNYYNIEYAIAVNSATSALHCAMMSLGLDIGDEVITSPYTMSATSTAILMVGGIPIFADVDEKTYCLNPKSVEDNITENTKAICAVNILGHPAQLSDLKKLAEKHKLILIEDNSQSPNAIHYNSYTGTIGDLGIFSFNRHKVMQSGEGGMLISKNKKLYEKAALFRNHGESVVGSFGIKDISNTAGLNLRMTEIEAAIALEQFKKLEYLTNERTLLANRLTQNLEHIEGISAPITLPNNKHVYYMYGMQYNEEEIGISRKLFVDAMTAEGLSVRDGYIKPTYLEPMYQRQIFLGKKGFPFTHKKRNGKLNYNQGLCPIVERNQNSTMLLTAVMQPPQTLNDMDLWTEGVIKIIKNKDKLVKAMSK